MVNNPERDKWFKRSFYLPALAAIPLIFIAGLMDGFTDSVMAGGLIIAFVAWIVIFHKVSTHNMPDWVSREYMLPSSEPNKEDAKMLFEALAYAREYVSFCWLAFFSNAIIIMVATYLFRKL